MGESSLSTAKDVDDFECCLSLVNGWSSSNKYKPTSQYDCMILQHLYEIISRKESPKLAVINVRSWAMAEFYTALEPQQTETIFFMQTFHRSRHMISSKQDLHEANLAMATWTTVRSAN